jgi:hypothetical protein
MECPEGRIFLRIFLRMGSSNRVLIAFATAVPSAVFILIERVLE